MGWIGWRLLAAWALLSLGVAVGWVVGTKLAVPLWGAWFGGGVGISLVVLVDGLRGRRLMGWLRSGQPHGAPRDRGFWGEMGYRIERALHQRERALDDERQRLQQFLSAVEASPNGVMLLDGREQIEWCNSVAADHLGLDPVRDRQQRLTNLVRAPALVAHLQAGRFDEPLSIPAPGGQGTLTLIVRPYGDGMKLLLSQDITERERSDAMRRDFVANVSHEIRTPLTVLAGFVQTLAELPLTEVERRRVLTLMQQQTDRMQSLVGDLLTLAQLEGSPRPAADRWVPLAHLLHRVQADAQSLSAGRHALAFDAPPPGLVIAGNEGELHSAVSNLVTNAVRYTPEGGRIDVRWRLRPDGSGELEVRDNGIGIAREHLPRLTERFYRVDGSRSRETGGTGLGLSIVKHVMQRHGGELDVHSEVGKGSSFRLVWPASRVRHEPPQASAAA